MSDRERTIASVRHSPDRPALRWKHKDTAADVDLQLVCERNPQVWFNSVANVLLGGLSRPD